MSRFTGLLGLVVMLGIAYALSTDRKAIRGRTIVWGLGLQFLFAFLVTKYSYGQIVMKKAGDVVNHLLSYGSEGAKFVFGSLGTGAPIFNLDNSPAAIKVGFVFAFQVLPTIIFIAAFFAVLYYYGVMQFIIKQVAKVMTRVMGVSGAESLDVAASTLLSRDSSSSAISTREPLTGSSVSGTSILAIRIVPGAVMITAARRCSALMPKKT